jgi:FMN phosphatase YigB (HAD superfamily)
LDFWFTTVYYAAGADNLWKEDRVRALGRMLRSHDWDDLPPSQIEAAVDAVHANLRRRGGDPGTTDPQALVSAYAERLGARLIVPEVEAGRTLSAAGLDEHPPLINPEANVLLRGLEARNIPVIAITNTARREESWKEFLGPRTHAPFLHIVTSCEVGQAKPAPSIFLEASRRLGLPPQEILHVGDRWELDVQGAQRAGFGAVLYRGLWSRYPEGLYPETDYGLSDDPEVTYIDRLEQLLEGDLLPGGPLPDSAESRPLDN